MAAYVRKGDRKVEDTRCNIHERRAYIGELRRQLGVSSVRRRGPAVVAF
ncbi:gpW family head-tail joining protein [Vibrio sp. S512-13]|nr:gpW family head-tail joining protein [Vibrio sp. S512-13]